MSREHRSVVRRRQGGFTYIGLLIAVALIGVGLLEVSQVWSKTAERQRWAQVNWVGQQYVDAIRSYYYANTGSVNFYPQKIDDLLLDARYLSLRRHIRRLYDDAVTAEGRWHPIAAPQGGIQGMEYVDEIDHTPVSRKFLFVPSNGIEKTIR